MLSDLCEYQLPVTPEIPIRHLVPLHESVFPKNVLRNLSRRFRKCEPISLLNSILETGRNHRFRNSGSRKSAIHREHKQVQALANRNRSLTSKLFVEFFQHGKNRRTPWAYLFLLKLWWRCKIIR